VTVKAHQHCADPEARWESCEKSVADAKHLWGAQEAEKAGKEVNFQNYAAGITQTVPYQPVKLG